MNIPRPSFEMSLTHSSRASRLATSNNTDADAPQLEPSSRMVNSAAARIYAAWLPHVGHDEALQQAQAFAGRFHVLLDGPLAPLPAEDLELDAALAAVSTAMSAP